MNLQGRVEDFNRELSVKSGCDEGDKGDFPSASDDKCVQIDKFGTPRYSYIGNIQGFSPNRALLAIGHFRTRNNLISDNYHGHEVNISWGGCPKENGENLQYAIYKEDNTNIKVDSYSNIPNIPEAEWKDIIKDDLYSGIKITNKDTSSIFFRIKRIDPPGSASTAIKELYTKPYNLHGQYNLFVKKEEQRILGVFAGPISSIINSVSNTMLGEGRSSGDVVKSGVVYKIYHAVVENTRFIRIVQALLMLHIVFMGFQMAAGLIEITAKTFLFKLLKIGIVITVISPSGWNIVSTYIIPFCIDGFGDLIVFMASAASSNFISMSEQQSLTDTEIIFGYFDSILHVLFSRSVWIKISALIFNGLIGFILLICIMIAVLYYLIMIAKATIAYLFTIISQSFLLILMPIFVPLSLFEMTKSIFESWAKYLISFAIQTLMVFCVIIVFTNLLIGILQSMLSFTVCKDCFLGISLTPLYDDCWIPYYKYMPSLHQGDDSYISGSGFASLAMSFGAGIAIFIITVSANSLCDLMPMIASVIITGSPIRNATVSGFMQQSIFLGRQTAMTSAIVAQQTATASAKQVYSKATQVTQVIKRRNLNKKS